MKIHPHLPVLAGLLASGMLLASCSGDHGKPTAPKKEPVAVTVAYAGKQSNNAIRASGRVESRQTAAIGTRVMGFITAIHVKAGDRVKKGQLLATISSDDLQAKRAQSRAMVAEAEAALKDALRDMERYQQLYEQQSASSKEFENAALHYNSIKARAEAARQMQKEAESML